MPAARAVPPLRDALARAAARLGMPAPVFGTAAGDALTLRTLADPTSGVLRSMVDRAGAMTGVTDRRVLATWLQGWSVYWVLSPVLGAWLLERRVAPLDPDGLAMAWDGQVATVTMADGPWAVLPNDPDAAGMIVAADESALRDLLHDRIVAMLDPWIAALHRVAGVGARQQWLQSADRIAGILQDAGAAAGREAEAVQAAERLLHRPGSPFGSRRGRFRILPVLDGVRDTVGFEYQRSTCCLAYRAPEGGYCATCPVRPSGGGSVAAA